MANLITLCNVFIVENIKNIENFLVYFIIFISILETQTKYNRITFGKSDIVTIV